MIAYHKIEFMRMRFLKWCQDKITISVTVLRKSKLRAFFARSLLWDSFLFTENICSLVFHCKKTFCTQELSLISKSDVCPTLANEYEDCD